MEIESGPINENEERRRPGVERVYRNREIAVSWEPKLCIHAGYCFRGLPEVFQPQERPWVKVDAATADKIAEVVMTCPTRLSNNCLWMNKWGFQVSIPSKEFSVRVVQ